jgi:hypothetical protein
MEIAAVWDVTPVYGRSLSTRLQTWYREREGRDWCPEQPEQKEGEQCKEYLAL